MSPNLLGVYRQKIVDAGEAPSLKIISLKSWLAKDGISTKDISMMQILSGFLSYDFLAFFKLALYSQIGHVPHIRAGKRLHIILLLLFGWFAPEIYAQSTSCKVLSFSFLPHKAVYSDADRRCDPGRRLLDNIEVNITTGGFYKLKFLARYSFGAGDEQLNESYYVLVRKVSSGVISYPVDANLIESVVDSVDVNGDSISYKVVVDDNTLSTRSALRDAGVFFLRRGQHIIEIYHYAVISNRFPQFISQYADTAFSDPCYEALTPPIVSGHLGGKYNAESIEFDSLAIEQVDCKAYDLSLRKTAGKDTIFTSGDTLSYSLSVANAGPGDALDFTVRDTLPPFVSVSNIIPAPTKNANGVLEWQVVFLPKDSVKIFSYQARVNVTPKDTTLALVNRGSVSAPNDTTGANDAAQATVIARPKPKPPPNYDLVFRKSASRDSVFTASDTLSYTLTVTNNGPNTAFQITLRDTLPRFVSAFGFSLQPSRIDNNVLEWQIDSLTTASFVTIFYSASVNVTPEDTTLALVNRGSISAPNDTSGANDAAQASVIARPKPKPPQNYDLAFRKSASSDSVFTGSDTLSYTLTVTNNGPNTAFQITLRDTLPRFVSAFGFSLQPDRIDNNVLEWRIDSLATASFVTIFYSASVNVTPEDTTLALVNRGNVSAPNDTVATNNTAQATVIAAPEPAIQNYDLTLSKNASIDTVITATGTFDYRLVIINRGPHTAHQITLLDTLPPFIAASGFSHAPSRIENNVIEWQLDSLVVNSAVQVSFMATVDFALLNTATELVNRSRVLAPNDTAAANNASRVSVIAVPKPKPAANYDLALTVTANKDTVFTEADTLGYDLTVKNFGPNNASTATISDTLPAFVTAFDFSRQPTRIENNVLEWQIAPLTVDGATTISFSVRVNVTPADTILALANHGFVAAPNDTFPANNFSEATVIAIKRPPVVYALQVTKIANADTVDAGEPFSYTISVTNVGTGTIANYTVRDILPPLLDPGKISNYFPKPPDEISGNTLSWNFSALAVGATQIVVFDVASPSLTAPGTAEVLNIAEVFGPNIPLTSNRDSAAVAIVAQPAVECYLDRNVWKPGIDPPLGVNFALTASSAVRIKIYDLAGTLIRDLLNQPFGAGQHRIEWDGRVENGLQAGSGLYVVTFESQQFIDWKKVIIVR